jgi:DNA-binding winged helix-turn-helix (wHTH) protein/TolB-like protein
VSERATFGLFELDPATGALTREGRPVRLQPQPARVLAILVDRAGEIVSRDDLRHQIWNDGTYVDFERGLNFCIAQIRQALGDSAESPRFIETVPKRGYRFIAPVRSDGKALTAPRDPVVPAPPIVLEPRRRHKSWVPIAAAAVLVALVSVFAVALWRAAPVDRRIRIAVVPFDNETGADDFDRIARGVADATVARLATPERVGRLSVIGNAADLYQPRAFRDLRKIGRALDAEYVVLAQMKRDASGVRLIAHLIRVSDESHLWANTYDRPAFTLEVQGEIAESIATAVLDRLTRASSPRT